MVKVAESNRALKIFATHLLALGKGLTVILPRRMKVEGEFFLYPTYTPNQTIDKFQPEYVPLFHEAMKRYNPNHLEIQFYAQVVNSFKLYDDDKVRRLAEHHTLNENAMLDYFHSSERGVLFVPIVRVYKLPTPYKIEREKLLKNRGAVTWIRLPEQITTMGLKPVLGEEEFARKMGQVSNF
ncbi:MAG: DUF1802 family protein [Asgard group archaeon]